MERRDFLKVSAVGAAGLMLPSALAKASAAPAPAAARNKKQSANDKVTL